ncbi:MAG TPA: hypothetical protein DEQ87_20220 [Algoriphagus sp.]|jgi:hypothetical protein|nr:hypothetical protein [Algoriphagus sp.]MAN85758.1 hypothetical protein [Algoriphagus sp.]HAD53564.1 hypothetical protein [Algoriphagus sp.]HAH38456.1 hypothetical protein [Algoriphagus sp.]HAS60556.1 hypothetical protein [Algoriphagus sp.]|tara:strand:+ start:220 stop:732 length:513 start_codon:yes stop_codon:yes gene_type:complete
MIQNKQNEPLHYILLKLRIIKIPKNLFLMKKCLLIFAFLYCCNAPLFAQSKTELEGKMTELTQALLSENVEKLRALTSTQLSYGHSGGVIESQKAFLKIFEEKINDYETWDISEQEISYASEDLGIVRHLVNGSIWVDGELRKLNLGVMLVWVKEEGGWKILARQAYRRP